MQIDTKTMNNELPSDIEMLNDFDDSVMPSTWDSPGFTGYDGYQYMLTLSFI